MSARRAARRLQLPAAPIVDGVEVPPELLDAGHRVWHERAAFIAFMTARGWSLPPQERLGGNNNSHPANRRRKAVGNWGVENGIVSFHDSPDFLRLNQMFSL
ncbi:MAG TPA: hypothetical protein VJT49_09300 [Amycolatopsis sp.]|uniref:hypothetical protein n=1 Tax=Amycolatopsis sp. TaxID=37632 RepID=UPI002B48BAB8|nr:hypothetical protein [Amycolatopsis sp.]HKS45297.1 hypothetical protein [Amycolatopsis sp.]